LDRSRTSKDAPPRDGSFAFLPLFPSLRNVVPIYAYRCESCGHQQDVLQKMSDAPLTVCTACGTAAFRKQVTAAGFQLKGSGWYVTDFRNNGAPPAKSGKDSGIDSGKDDGAGAAGKSADASAPAAGADTSANPAGTSAAAPAVAAAAAPAASSSASGPASSN